MTNALIKPNPEINCTQLGVRIFLPCLSFSAIDHCDDYEADNATIECFYPVTKCITMVQPLN